MINIENLKLCYCDIHNICNQIIKYVNDVNAAKDYVSIIQINKAPFAG